MGGSGIRPETPTFGKLQGSGRHPFLSRAGYGPHRPHSGVLLQSSPAATGWVARQALATEPRTYMARPRNAMPSSRTNGTAS